MTSGYIPPSGEHGPDEILTALKEQSAKIPLSGNVRLRMSPATSPAAATSRRNPPPLSWRRCWELSNAEKVKPASWVPDGTAGNLVSVLERSE